VAAMAEPQPPPRPLPELRASDADREHAAEVVRKAAGVGRLTVEELGGRLDAIYAARTQGELEALVEDLTPAGAGDRPAVRVLPGNDGTRWVVSIMGGSDRKGRWRVARKATVINVMGGGVLDFNDAELADNVVEVRVFSLMGGSNICVPEGLDVEVSEFALMGGNGIKLGASPPDREGPLLRLRIFSVMGGTDVRRGRKRSRRERRAEREQQLER